MIHLKCDLLQTASGMNPARPNSSFRGSSGIYYVRLTILATFFPGSGTAQRVQIHPAESDGLMHHPLPAPYQLNSLGINA